jgi:hypothetical protein
MAVLLTNLSEHMPSDPRLAKFLESAGTVLNFFEPFLGRIEIKTAEKVERVYFEIDENNIEQVPILPTVTNICLQSFVTCTFYIFVAFNQYSLVGQVFCNHFEPIF